MKHPSSPNQSYVFKKRILKTAFGRSKMERKNVENSIAIGLHSRIEILFLDLFEEFHTYFLSEKRGEKSDIKPSKFRQLFRETKAAPTRIGWWWRALWEAFERIFL
ncbi:hypothetical protein EFP84_11545 [Leptospira kmetyi]|uniref:Uncharacterized protein n=1 Tax=Leptospira kmetyi TaxID=408139 RepID=A0AAD0XP68_9LEPT|nr:hypothetical protein EFP84_11545 [Leptospira kmetyi]